MELGSRETIRNARRYLAKKGRPETNAYIYELDQVSGQVGDFLKNTRHSDCSYMPLVKYSAKMLRDFPRLAGISHASIGIPEAPANLPSLKDIDLVLFRN